MAFQEDPVRFQQSALVVPKRFFGCQVEVTAVGGDFSLSDNPTLLLRTVISGDIGRVKQPASDFWAEAVG
jgi:hypothetical protein